MAEDSVTVIRCLKCAHSGNLTLVTGRFWCAWCGDWSEIQTECLRDRTVIRNQAVSELHAVREPGYALQPLRVPQGWHVVYNGSLFEVDPPHDASAHEEDWWYVFKQDMLMMQHKEYDRLLDVGWYPDGDLMEGAYGLSVYEGGFRGRLLHEYSTRSRQELVAEIERLLTAITFTGGRLSRA